MALIDAPFGVSRFTYRSRNSSHRWRMSGTANISAWPPFTRMNRFFVVPVKFGIIEATWPLTCSSCQAEISSTGTLMRFTNVAGANESPRPSTVG